MGRQRPTRKISDRLSSFVRVQPSRSVRPFLVTALFFVLPALVAVVLMDKLVLHAVINAYHAPLLDGFFGTVTHLADGVVPTVLALSLLFFRDVRSFLMMGLGCGVGAIVVQLLKRQVFPHMHRPAMFREELGDMDWVSGIDLHNHFSFPSGHATAAFGMCLALAVVSGRRRWGAVLAVAASVLAFSRVYLSQHFLEDAIAGAVLGTGASLLVYRWLYVSPFSRKAWLGRRPGQRPK